MATFEETVVATGRDTFWRLDGLEDTHPLLEDKSGNDRHATCFDIVEGNTHLHGLPSPVESDAGSWAMSGRVGVWEDTVNRFQDFCWFAFGYSSDSATPKTLLCRSGHWGTGLANIFGFSPGGDEVLGRLRIGGVTHDLSAPCEPNTYYFVALRYNAGQIDLLLNAVVVDSALATGDIQVSSDTEFYLGAQQSVVINVNHSAGVDEIATGPSLTDGELLTIYESALNALLLTGYSNVISSAILYSGVEPDPVAFPWRHNWSDLLIERISFSTGVSTAVKGYESANAQRIKPRREIEISQVTRDDAERRMLRAKLKAHGGRKWFIPMLEDRERLAVPISSGVTTITTDTQYKNYEIGGYVELRQLNDAGTITASEQLLISGLTNTEITTATPTTNSYTTPEVMPACRAILESSATPRGHTDSVEELTVLARLIAEDEKVVSRRIVEWTPTTTYKSYEVFPVALWPNNWSELRDYDITRQREDVDHELGSFAPTTDTDAASEAFSWRIILDTKQKQAEFLGWFYARAGSLNYLWVPTMQRDFDVVSAVSDDLTVAGHNYFDNFSGSEFRRDLAFVYNDNSMVFRRIESVSLDGANEVLDLDTSVPTLTNLRSVSYLLFCRLDNDTIEIARETDTKSRVSWMFREILSSPV